MTSRNTTGLLSLPDQDVLAAKASHSDTIYRIIFGAIGWPWLIYSLWGGSKRNKRKLLERVGLEEGSLPHLGSWKADTGFLHRIVDAVEELQPRVVVELGAGATTLVCAKALERNGGGLLVSYDQHRGFIEATTNWIAEEGADADLRWAPLTASVESWPGSWYSLHEIPASIDLLIIDGPPWTVHPFVRGAADCLFERLSPGAIVLLDDAARPGERVVARRWRRKWPDMTFERLSGSTKGTLVGRKAAAKRISPIPKPANDNTALARWRRAAAIAALFGAGWFTSEISSNLATPAHAASIVDEAQNAYSASLARQLMASQPESVLLDRREIASATGLLLPEFPSKWEPVDVQLYPSNFGQSVMLTLLTDNGEEVSVFAAFAETPAGEFPLMDERDGRPVAYWEEGRMAYALTGKVNPARLQNLAASLAADKLEPS